jgi:glycosyltransferase involved in cell wall biosynthesis
VSVQAAAPEVSVFVQTYRHAEYIRQAIDGVLAQEAPFDFELVIADDCSTDGTREVLREYRARHADRIRLLLPDRNLGPTQLFRRGVAELRGRYVAWLDGDDYWCDEGKLARQVAALRENPDWVACFHDATVRDADGERPDRPYVPVIERDTVTLADLLRQNCVPSLSLMARGELVRTLPDWVWEGLWSDWLALVAMARHGDIGYLPGAMGVYRTHRGGLCSGLSRSAQLNEDLRALSIMRDRLAPEWAPAIGASMRERRCQLVVEEAGVPFAGAVAVIGPERGTPTYLNGRNVLQLSVGVDLPTLERRDRNGAFAAQLERFRLQAEGEERGHPHFGDAAPSLAAPAGLHLLAVEPTAAWLERESRLGRQLPDSSAVVSRGHDCALLRIDSPIGPPAQLGAVAEIGEVVSSAEAEKLLGAHLDLPVAHRSVDAHAVEIAGWAIGGESVVVAVELVREGRPFRRIPTGGRRLDLERGFARRPDVHFAGFDASVSFVGLEGETTVEVRAVLKDGRRMQLASIPIRLACLEAAPGLPTPLVSVVLPGHGPLDWLEEALESALAQTYARLEPIVVDGETNGRSRLLVERYPGVRWVEARDGSAAAAREAGQCESRGELFVFLDVGDLLTPRALEHGVDEWRRRPGADFTLGSSAIVAGDQRRWAT